MGQEKSTEGSRDQMTCAVMMCVHMQGGGNHKAGCTAGQGGAKKKAKTKRRTKPHSASGGREAQSEQAAGERDGANGQTRDRGWHAKIKNKNNNSG